MTVKIGDAGSWADGDVLNATDLNDTFNFFHEPLAFDVLNGATGSKVFKGTDLDLSFSGPTTVLGSIIIQVSSGSLVDADHVVVNWSLLRSLGGGALGTVDASIGSRITDSGSSFTDITGSFSLSNADQFLQTMVDISADARSDGVDIEIRTSGSISNGASGTITNHHLYVKPIG